MDIERKWQKAMMQLDATIKQAIINLNETGIQIILCVSANNTLLGTVTDGDIRRGLLRGLNLSNTIDMIVNRNVLVVPANMSRALVLDLMRANKLQQLPIVDETHQIVGLHLWDEISTSVVRSNIMLIMAGGFGSRLLPYTENCPKPLLLVNDKPMLEHIIERAKAEGFENFMVAVYYLGHMIEDYFGNGEPWQIDIKYLREELPLGTAGALSLIDSSLLDRPFIVSNGDVLTDISYGELLDFHISHDAAATMVVMRHEWQHPFGVVQTKGVDITSFEEKPITYTYVNAGIYVLEPSAIEFLRKNEHCDMPQLFDRLRENGMRTIVYPIHESWLDVGRPADLYKARLVESSVECT
jgi:dTDP-glucose pyrophosphorylase